MEDFTNIHMECTECGGNMVLDEDRIMLVCPYCGNHEALDSITASRLNAQDDKVAAFAQMKANREAQRAAAERHARVSGRVGKIVRIVIGVFIALCLLGVISVKVEDMLWQAEQAQRLEKTLEWPDTPLAQMIPQPTQTKGAIESYADSFEFEVITDSESDWVTYVGKLKEAGFTVDAKTSNSGYDAYNEEGYYVSVYYWKYNDKPSMEVTIEAPFEAKTIVMPSSGVGALVPTPPSTMGKIYYANEDNFRVILANVTPEAYGTYVEACINAGFNKDYSRQDSYYYGNDSEGNRLRVEYLGYNKIEISIYSKSK